METSQKSYQEIEIFETIAFEVEEANEKPMEEPVSDEQFETVQARVQPAICDQCGKGFSNVYTLGAHKKQVHYGIKEFSCEICFTKFATKYKLKRHHLGVHSDERNFHCEFCNHSFKTRDMIVKHQRTHYQNESWTCSDCEQVFKFKSGLDYHKKIKHSINAGKSLAMSQKPVPKILTVYPCTHCEQNFTDLKSLKSHEKSHILEFSCNQENCSQAFKTKKELSKHEKVDHSEVPFFSCSYCQKQYKTKANFEAHIATHEKTEMEDYEYLVEEEFDDVNVVIEEIFDDEGNEEDSESFKDDLIRKIDENFELIEKIEIIEPPIVDGIIVNSTPISSEENLEFFHTEEDLIDDGNFYEELETTALSDNDVIQGTDLVNFGVIYEELKRNPSKDEIRTVCHECGATFKNTSHLKRHIQRKHRKNEHNLECDICGSRFLLSYDLKRHMIKHSTNRDFKCEFCTKEFKTELTLRNHVKVLHHPTEKPERKFKCQLCDRSYLHKRHLEYHTRKHTGDHRFKCSDCKNPEKLFYYADALKWHMIRHHGQPAPYTCRHCNRRFIHEKTLHTHENEHDPETGSLAVECPVCGKSVSEGRHLSRHMRCHTGKEFQCKCGQSFKERAHLSKHKLKCTIEHTGEEQNL